MKETTIVEKKKVDTRYPILIEGLPGLGLVGKIVIQYLVKQLKAKKIADLYSPYFAYYVLVDKKGNIRLLRSEFHHWHNKKGKNDLILLTGDTQAQSIEGQYEVADTILNFVLKKNINLIITIGGYRKEANGEPRVFVSATNNEILKKSLEAGAKKSPSGNPIVGTAGLLIGLAKFKEIDASCLLVETPGYLPDPKAAKSVLKVIMKMLNFEVDLSDLDKEISKSKQIEESMRKIEKQRRKTAKKKQEIQEERVTYIS
jgi:uncharacterized protein (TIGR00162 family)